MSFYTGHGYFSIGIIEIVMIVVPLILFALFIIAYFMSIKCLVDAAWAKTERLSRGKLWFIGLFTTPVVLGLITCALKDEKGARAVAQVEQTTRTMPQVAAVPESDVQLTAVMPKTEPDTME